jgi:hypothetical protein
LHGRAGAISRDAVRQERRDCAKVGQRGEGMAFRFVLA